MRYYVNIRRGDSQSIKSNIEKLCPYLTKFLKERYGDKYEDLKMVDEKLYFETLDWINDIRLTEMMALYNSDQNMQIEVWCIREDEKDDVKEKSWTEVWVRPGEYVDYRKLRAEEIKKKKKSLTN